MKITIKKIMRILLPITLTSSAMASAPTIDSFNVQSFLKLSNNSAVSASSADFVFAIFKGSTCIWAKRYSSIAINSGVINQKISGNGTNITSISNTSATAGECVSDFSGTALDTTLLNTGSPAALGIRVYAETTIDSYKPIWDIPLNSAPSAFIADIANTATTASDLASSKKVGTSSGATDSGKFPYLDSSGLLDNSFINSSSLTITNSQVSGLGTASTANTGTIMGTIPVLGAGGRLAASLLPTYSANKIMASDGTGVIDATYATTNSSSGASDSGKVPLLNGSGKLDASMIDSSSLTLDPTTLSSAVSVAKGGTGVSTITSGSLLVGNATSAVSELAPGANGTLLLSNGSAWTATAPNAANIVDMTSTQSSIGGSKTFIGAIEFTSATAPILDNGVKLKASGAGSTTLSHYEEGTFTPVYTADSTAGACTYSVQTGVFTRIGKLVHFSITLSWSGCATAPIGNALVTGLPYASNTTSGLVQAVTVFPSSYTTATDWIFHGRIQPNTSQIEIWTTTPTATPVQDNLTTIDTAATFVISGSYQSQ